MSEELTDEEARRILTADGGATPASRYGRNAEECADVALAAAKIIAAEQGEPLDADGLNGTMSLVVNDSTDIASLIVRYGPEHGYDPAVLLSEETLHFAQGDVDGS